jgi:hypothetical protein
MCSGDLFPKDAPNISTILISDSWRISFFSQSGPGFCGVNSVTTYSLLFHSLFLVPWKWSTINYQICGFLKEKFCFLKDLGLWFSGGNPSDIKDDYGLMFIVNLLEELLTVGYLKTSAVVILGLLVLQRVWISSAFGLLFTLQLSAFSFSFCFVSGQESWGKV